MWIVVYMSASKDNTERLTRVLEDNKIISRIRSNKEQSCFEVLVPQSELTSAQDLIFDNELF